MDQQPRTIINQTHNTCQISDKIPTNATNPFTPKPTGDKGKGIPSTSKTYQHDNHTKNNLRNTSKNIHNHVKSNIHECSVQREHIFIDTCISITSFV